LPSPVFWQPFVYSFSSRDFNLALVKECLSLLEGTLILLFLLLGRSRNIGSDYLLCSDRREAPGTCASVGGRKWVFVLIW
jgi:hypothetical protein